MKTVKKLFLLALSILLCMTFFSACKTKTETWTPPLVINFDADIETQAKQAFINALVTPDWGDCYIPNENDVITYRNYGPHNNCAVMVLFYAVEPWDKNAWGLNIHREVVVGNFSFYYDYGSSWLQEVTVYQDGKIYSLQSAYEKGLLLSTDLQNIAWLHNEGVNFAERDTVDVSQIMLEPKIYNTETMKSKFTDDMVMLGIDKNFQHWDFFVSDFAALGIKSLTQRTYTGSGDRSVWLYLANPGKKNVLNIIKELEKRAYVKWAEPNYIGQLV